MSDVKMGPWTLGMDEITADTDMSPTAVRRAINVTFDREGNARRRPGKQLLLADSTVHSLWTSEALGMSFCGHGDQLARVEMTGDNVTLTSMLQLNSAEPLSFDDLKDGIVFSNRSTLGTLDRGLAAKLLGIDPPHDLTAVPAGIGGLYGGRYGVSLVYSRDQEESGASYAVFIDVPDGGGIQLSKILNPPAGVDRIRLYRTEANGSQLFYAMDIPIGMTDFLVGNSTLGRACATENLSRMPSGSIVRAWRGRLLVARGRTLWVSEPMQYGAVNLMRGFFTESALITMVEAVNEGIYVGTAHGVAFYRGDTPTKWERNIVSRYAPIAGTGLKVQTSIFGKELASIPGVAALWLTAAGYVVGIAGGTVFHPQAARIKSVVARGGSSLVSNRQVVSSVY